MRVCDLAKEFNTTSEAILAKLRSMKLKARDSDQELNTAVAIVIRSEMMKELKGGSLNQPRSLEGSLNPSPKVLPGLLPESVKAQGSAKESQEKEKAKAQKLTTPATKKPFPATPKISRKTKPKAKEAIAPTITKKAPLAKAAEKPVLKEAFPLKAKAKPKPSEEPFISVKPLPKKPKKTIEAPKAARAKGIKVPASESVSVAVKEAVRPPGPPPAVSPAPGEVSPASRGVLQPLEINIPISVKDLSVRLQQKPSVVLKRLLEKGIFANINQNLEGEVVKEIALSFGYEMVKAKTQEEQLWESHKLEEDPSQLKPRAPVVTFMGHVDHGKTSLLDKIRKSSIADQEHGGITQHIGAYLVNHPKGRIAFLDTPGHEAFTAMRSRGAHLTDIVILVVAADEGVMPQTEEALNHARAAKVPIVVALNKIDKSSADPDRVKKELADRGLIPEDWGGKTVVAGVSALSGEGIEHLLEMILLEAELLELKANYDKKASGVVVEAHMSQGKGPMATVIVQNGTLKEGDIVVVGNHFGRIRAMFDDREKPIQEAIPSSPVEILGLSGVPEAGDPFYVVDQERLAREITLQRQEQQKAKKLQEFSKITLEDLYSQIQEGKIKELNVIVKADVQGSLEAIVDSLKKIPSEGVGLNFIHTGVGDINASDVILADASNAIIIGFQVGQDTRAQETLAKHPVDVRTYRIIYDAVKDVKKALEGLLEPKTRKKFVARIEVRQIFKISKAGLVAGCFVQKGKIHRKVQIDCVRNGQVIFTGSLSSLKRFKDDVREVGEGLECGLTLNGFSELQVGDILEAFEIEKIARTL